MLTGRLEVSRCWKQSGLVSKSHRLHQSKSYLEGTEVQGQSKQEEERSKDGLWYSGLNLIGCLLKRSQKNTRMRRDTKMGRITRRVTMRRVTNGKGKAIREAK